MNQLVWLRNDLRADDNSALAEAMAAGPTVALYLISPGQWREHGDAPCKLDFWLRNLHGLARRLEQLNVPLLIRHAEHWQAAPAVLVEVCRQQRIAQVHVNRQYGVNEQRRDQAVSDALAAEGVLLQQHLDALLFAPGSVLTKSGGYFQVYSQFRKVCVERLLCAPPACRPLPRVQAPLAIASDPLPTVLAGFASPDQALRQLWPAGEFAAHERLSQFVEQALDDYDSRRDFPALDGTSRLSPYLVAGVLSPRQCLRAALLANQGEIDSGSAGVRSWVNELLWREFYTHLLHGYPRLSMGRPFRLETQALAWRQAPQDLAAWQQGRTGFPLIDAAMRCLAATGWMHNRLRMVVAMFLTKNLLIDWREGERWFMSQLIDGDLAANNGGWQWSASTGTDAAPYFRLFNPLSQSQKFDPDGRFIRRWLPELAGLSTREIHQPPRGGLFGAPDYPAPIVDLSASRARALAAFRELPERAS